MPAKRKLTPEDIKAILYFHSLGVKSGEIARRYLHDKVTRWTVWKTITEHGRRERKLQQNVSQHDVRRQTSLDRGYQIDHYQPSMLSSFNHGLGTPSPRELIRRAIRAIASRQLSPYDLKAEENKLRQFVNDRDQNPMLGKMRQHLKERMVEIAGFDGGSDHDEQFGELNELARFLLRAEKELRGVKHFRPKQLVDALLMKVLGERARKVIQRIEKQLICPRCREPRSYVLDRQPMFYLCVKCGKQVPIERARFRITTHDVDQRYIATVDRLLLQPHPNQTQRYSMTRLKLPMEVSP